MAVILTAKNLHKTYETASGAVNALRGIDLTIEEGLFYAVIGRSGCGKSTLLHVLGGLLPATEGTVLIGGRDICDLSDEEMAIFRRRNMGFVFQQYNLLEDYNIRSNICMPLKLDNRRADERFFKELTQRLGLEEKLSKYPSELSGGEQQRADIRAFKNGSG